MPPKDHSHGLPISHRGRQTQGEEMQAVNSNTPGCQVTLQLEENNDMTVDVRMEGELAGGMK